MAYVYGDKVKQVFPTEEVVLRMREGFLKEERNYQPPEEVAEVRAEEGEGEVSNENPPASFSGTTKKTEEGQALSTEAAPANLTETAAQRRAREKAEKDNS
jgi:hypothetical protein